MKELLPEGRSSRYVVVKFGYLTRGESLNVAVLAWEHGGPEQPVYQYHLVDWSRVQAAFPRAGGDELRDDVLKRLEAIKTVGDYRAVLEQIGPYTPFEFTEERASLTSAGDTLEFARDFFCGPYRSQG